MSEGKEQKEVKLRNLVQKAVTELLTINAVVHGATVTTQCHRVAIEVGNMLAPQIYGNRVHGVSNAVSVCVRHCSEALFWLDMAHERPESVIMAVEDLIHYLSAPTL